MEVRRVVVRSRLASITTAHIFRVMRSFRRILAALLVLVFGLGMAAHGVQAGEMAQMTVAVAADHPMPDDRTSAVEGKSVSGRVYFGGCRIIKKKILRRWYDAGVNVTIKH